MAHQNAWLRVSGEPFLVQLTGQWAAVLAYLAHLIPAVPPTTTNSLCALPRARIAVLISVRICRLRRRT